MYTMWLQSNKDMWTPYTYVENRLVMHVLSKNFYLVKTKINFSAIAVKSTFSQKLTLNSNTNDLSQKTLSKKLNNFQHFMLAWPRSPLNLTENKNGNMVPSAKHDSQMFLKLNKLNQLTVVEIDIT